MVLAVTISSASVAALLAVPATADAPKYFAANSRVVLPMAKICQAGLSPFKCVATASTAFMLVNTIVADCVKIFLISAVMPADCMGVVSIKETISIITSFDLAASTRAVSIGRVL